MQLPSYVETMKTSFPEELGASDVAARTAGPERAVLQ